MDTSAAFTIWAVSGVLLILLFTISIVGGIAAYYRIRTFIELEKQKFLNILNEAKNE